MYSLSLDEDNINIKSDSGVVRLELINLEKNRAPVKWTIGTGVSKSFSRTTYKFDRVHIAHNYKEFKIYNIIDDKLVEVLSNDNLGFSLPFVCLTGHSGGGTSIVAKSFIYLGMHMGADCGDFSNRKAFESVSIRFFIDQILHSSEDSPVNSCISKALASYKYKHDKINCFKITDLESKNNLANGIGLSKLFRDIKFISIVKKSKGTGASKEGTRFNEASELDIYKQQHPKVQAPIFHLDWYKYFTDYTYVNEVLEFIGADIRLTRGDFEEMLDFISFDNKTLT